MLTIIRGTCKNIIMNPVAYFDISFHPRYLTQKWAKEIIYDVDKSKLVGTNLVLSPVFGPMAPSKLSGGTKALLVASANRDKIFNVTTCGENCAKWFVKLAEDDDIKIGLQYTMEFKEPFKIKFDKTNKVYTTWKDLLIAQLPWQWTHFDDNEIVVSPVISE